MGRATGLVDPHYGRVFFERVLEGILLTTCTRREAPIATALPERDWSIGLIVLAHQPSTHHKTNRHGQGSGRNGPDRSSAMSPAIIFVLAFLVCTTAAKPALLSKPALPLASSVFDDTVYGWEEVAQSAASVAAPPLEAWLDSNNVTLYGVRIARFSHGLYSDIQLRGVVATEQVSTGDVLASVPSVRHYGRRALHIPPAHHTHADEIVPHVHTLYSRALVSKLVFARTNT